MRTNIILVGFMGTGKSSVGRRLAERLGMDFYDTDIEMEKITGMDLMTLYWKYGKIRFQSEENLVLVKLLRRENCVIATGGTLQLSEERLELMRQSGMLVCLQATPEMIRRRVVRRANRPLLRQAHLLEELYASQVCWELVADLVIDTTEKNFEEILRTISSAWECEKHGIL
ncbi:MAG: shikimate kinase [Peptococcaceae bacterium]